jgi:hypothetical protein
VQINITEWKTKMFKIKKDSQGKFFINLLKFISKHSHIFDDACVPWNNYFLNSCHFYVVYKLYCGKKNIIHFALIER